MKEFIIKQNDANQRLDKFLAKALKNLPPSFMYKYIRTKKIKVNRKRALPNYILQTGDTVQLFIKEEFLAEKQTDTLFEKINPDLNIVYEDENLLLCDKKCGMLVHSDDEGEKNTLIEHIKAYLWRKNEYSPENEQSFAPALCNRIDRNTGGIVIAAKNAETLRIINEKIKKNEIKKSYLCIAHGIFDKKEDILTAYLKKDAAANTVKIYGKQVENSKKIITGYKVLLENNGLSLLRVDLFTGRTHQIRAQMAYIGHPLYGDGKYAKNADDRNSGAKYQALYSYKITFDFAENSTPLDYLRGKTFTVNKDNIWFLSENIIGKDKDFNLKLN